MTEFVSEIAQKHFSQQPTTSLLRECFRQLESGDWSVVLAGLHSQCQPIQLAAAQTVKQRLCHPGTRASFRSLIMGSKPAAALLHTLAEIDRLLWCDSDSVKRVEQWLINLFPNPDGEVASAATILLLRRFPTAIPTLINHLESSCTPEIARRLCLEGNENTIWPLIRFYGIDGRADQSVPSSLGLALTPNWIAENQPVSPEVATRLATACGYIDAQSKQFPIEHFRHDLWFVNQPMSELTASDVRQRVNEIMWEILRESPLQMTGAKRTSQNDAGRLNPSCNLDRGLLLAAVRELDYSNIQQRRAESPIGTADPLAGAAFCLHASADYAARMFIDDPFAEGAQLGVPADHRGKFVLSRAAVTLEPNDDKRVEAELLFLAKWKLMQIDSTWCPGDYTWSYTDYGTPRFPAASRIVCPETDRLPAVDNQFVSPCARAVHRVLDRLPNAACPEVLPTKESQLAPFLTPLGVEIQIPKVADELHLGWKESFRAVGIPSPRRPECQRMLEAALPPAASYHAPVAFLKSLPELGVINEPQDVGVHISLQGNLGPNARYLAFPQLFLNQPIDRSPRRRSGLRLVMSKGLVAINKDVVQCRWAGEASCRTELRVFIAGVQQAGDILNVDDAILGAIKSTHLIGSAFLSPLQEVNEIASEFAVSIETLVETLPLPFRQLLQSNFYEATGDPSAASLLDYLPILKLREAAKPFLSDSDFREALQHSLDEIRTKTANRILEAFMRKADTCQ
jgi:hypothetical protein